ncbi:MAG: hypothetical protein JEZ04_04480 [Spirochaetales bacterium]|nr:hypothetical protein [Spirochaetales bacterium]
MCPDSQLVSTYYDKELDQRWSGEIKSHIAGCDKCGIQVSKYQEMSKLLGSCRVPGEQEMKLRVLGVIERRRKVEYHEVFWKKHLAVSVPVLMGAAALMIIFFAGILMGFFPSQTRDSQVVEEIRTHSIGINVQVINLEDAAAYILADDSGFDLLITIPSNETLSVNGEPQLIREADYKRGQ